MFSGILRRQAISVKTQKEELDDLALKFEESSVQQDKGALNKKLTLVKLEISQFLKIGQIQSDNYFFDDATGLHL